MHLKIYRAYVVQCAQCACISTYWSKHVLLPLALVVKQALIDGWQATPQGNICLECRKMIGE